MRRSLAAVVAVVAVALVAVGQAGAQGPAIVVTPAAGSQYDTFAFDGVGFTPSTELDVVFVAPDGVEYAYFVGDAQAVVIVEADGTFALSVVPALDLNGAPAGRWQIEFCTAGRVMCLRGEFEIFL